MGKWERKDDLYAVKEGREEGTKKGGKAHRR